MPVLEALNYQYRCRYGRHSLNSNTEWFWDLVVLTCSGGSTMILLFIGHQVRIMISYQS